MPFLTGGFLSSLPRLRSSSAVRSNSVGAVSSQSGHSADDDADAAASDSDGEHFRPLPAMVMAERSAGLGAGVEQLNKPGAYNSREDVGCLCVMSGNWGGNRTNQKINDRINEDVRRGPASILLLQEAQPELSGVLTSPAVAGDPAHENQLFRRTASQYDCVTGTESGNSLLVASRHNLTKSLTKVLWIKRQDGEYILKGKKKTANSRILVATVEFNQPVSGHRSLTVCNVHFHYMTAKKHSGFATSNTSFWTELADIIRGYGVQILAGDFNMSMFCVLPKLRELGLIANTAAWFPWVQMQDDRVQLDSCGIFLIGGVASVKTVHSYDDFANYHGRGTVNVREDDEAAEDDANAGSSSCAFLQFNNGQGYPSSSYLPKHNFDAQMRAALTFSVEDSGTGVPNRPLPPSKQKRCDVRLFDPDSLLFRSGVHMPLMVMLGKNSRRSEEAVTRRWQNFTRRQNKQIG